MFPYIWCDEGRFKINGVFACGQGVDFTGWSTLAVYEDNGRFRVCQYTEMNGVFACGQGVGVAGWAALALYEDNGRFRVW